KTLGSGCKETNPKHDFGKRGCRTWRGDALFTFFGSGLAPVVLYCVIVITAGIDAFLTNAIRKSTWPQTAVTVVQSQDFGDVAAAFRGTPNTFPDPRGTLKYVIDGKSYDWRGRGGERGGALLKTRGQMTAF